MNILVVTAYPPVLHWHGGGVRMYHNIRILSEKHNVYVLSFFGTDEEREMLRSVRPICESVKAIRRVPDFRPHWLSPLPFLVREFSTPEMHRAVDISIRVRKIDVIQCEYLQMAQFRRRGTRSVLTAHEALSRNARTAFLREADPLEKLRLFYRWMQILRYETGEVRKFDTVVTMTEEDAKYLRSYASGSRIRAVPIGIDPQEFRPQKVDPAGELRVVFVGNFNHSPNVEAAHFLVHEIAPRFPEVRFLISGSPVPVDIGSGPNVSFPGYVSDTRDLYQRPNTIVAAPLFSGTGQRVKLLEAFAMACPVVTTTLGAMGFPIENNVHAIIANTAVEFEAAIRQLAASAECRMQFGNRARQMILDRLTWDAISKDLWDVVAQTSISN